MSRIAYFDCWNGAAGDMIVGALLDAGGDFAALQGALLPLGQGGFTLALDRVQKNGLACAKFRVHVVGDEGGPAPASHHDGDVAHAHRTLGDVMAIVDGSALPVTVKTSARRVFTLLAEAEAAVHGTTLEAVHFHEVGALDAIADVVGACFLLDALGVTEVRCSPLPIGRGFVRAAHGLMPVPAPATLRLLKGVATLDNGERGELLTPTGAAILKAFATSFGPPPAMTADATGYGAGDRDHERLANALRVTLGEPAAPQHDATTTTGAGTAVPAAAMIDDADVVTEALVVLEANLDDLTGQQAAFLLEELLAAGALDAWHTPVVMKKGRPALVVSALAAPASVAAVRVALFRQSTTLGVRASTVARASLRRDVVTVTTPWGEVPVKLAFLHGSVVTATPEYEDCARAARAHGVPLKDVQLAAAAAEKAERAARG